MRLIPTDREKAWTLELCADQECPRCGCELAIVATFHDALVVLCYTDNGCHAAISKERIDDTER